MSKELVIPTTRGPVVLRPRQVVKMEGEFFMIESVNEVRNGRQIRMYHMNDAEALKYYVPVQPATGAPAPGVVPSHAAQPGAAPGVSEPAAPAAPVPPAPDVPGQVPGAEAARTGTVPETPAAPAEPGMVPETMAPQPGGAESAPKPVQGLSQEEIQDGLASGKYTQNAEGDVFKNPNYRDPNDPQAGAAPNHKVDPAAADKAQE